MRERDGRTSGVTYIGPRTFALVFCAICAFFTAAFFGLDRFIAPSDPDVAPLAAATDPETPAPRLSAAQTAMRPSAAATSPPATPSPPVPQASIRPTVVPPIAPTIAPRIVSPPAPTAAPIIARRRAQTPSRITRSPRPKPSPHSAQPASPAVKPAAAILVPIEPTHASLLVTAPAATIAPQAVVTAAP